MILKNNKNDFEIYKNLFNSIKNSVILKEDEEQMIKNWTNSNK